MIMNRAGLGSLLCLLLLPVGELPAQLSFGRFKYIDSSDPIEGRNDLIITTQEGGLLGWQCTGDGKLELFIDSKDEFPRPWEPPGKRTRRAAFRFDNGNKLGPYDVEYTDAPPYSGKAKLSFAFFERLTVSERQSRELAKKARRAKIVATRLYEGPRILHTRTFDLTGSMKAFDRLSCWQQ